MYCIYIYTRFPKCSDFLPHHAHHQDHLVPRPLRHVGFGDTLDEAIAPKRREMWGIKMSKCEMSQHLCGTPSLWWFERKYLPVTIQRWCLHCKIMPHVIIHHYSIYIPRHSIAVINLGKSCQVIKQGCTVLCKIAMVQFEFTSSHESTKTCTYVYIIINHHNICTYIYIYIYTLIYNIHVYIHTNNMIPTALALASLLRGLQIFMPSTSEKSR